MERYILGQSSEGHITSSCEEVRLDVQLQPNPYYGKTIIYGRAQNVKKGEWLRNVFITCCSLCGTVVGQSETDQYGQYFIPDVPHNLRVYLRAQKPGFLDFYSNIFFTGCREQTSIPIYMRQARENNAAICGHVYDAYGCDICGAMIYLSKIQKHTVGHYSCHAVCSTISNRYGQFVFDYIMPGVYTLSVRKKCYEHYVSEITILPEEDIIPYRVILTERHFC